MQRAQAMCLTAVAAPAKRSPEVARTKGVGMVNVRVVRTEITALGHAASWLPWRFLDGPPGFDPNAPHPTPIVFAHGFLGDRTNFRGLARALDRRGITNTSYFEYGPRIDWPRLATRLG